jgi:1-acyl-sn-glycerol-3-phosphate acyltransferase
MAKMVDVIKLVWLLSIAIIDTFIFWIPVSIAAMLSRTGKAAFQLCQVWAWFLIKAGFSRVVIKGLENVEPGRSYVIIPNHVSLYDIPALLSGLGVPFRWIIKKELMKIPGFGYGLYASRNVFIDRSNRERAIASIRKGVERLPKGVSLLFFPEGTRSPNGKLLPFKKGAFVTALDAEMPLLPVSINGSREIMPKGSLVFKPGTIEVIIGQPIPVDGLTMDDLPDLIERAEDAVRANLRCSE